MISVVKVSNINRRKRNIINLMLRIFCLRQYRLMILLFSMFIISSPSYGSTGNNPDGIKLQSTRVIYPGESHNGITFTVTNNTAKPFLLQSRVIPWQADEQETYPVIRVEGCHLLYCLPYSGWKHQMR